MADVTITTSQKLRLTAVATNAANQTIPSANPIAWTTNNGDVVLSNTSSDTFEVDATGVAVGTTTVTATDAILSLTKTFVIAVVSPAPNALVVQSGPVVPQSQSGQQSFGLGLGYGSAPVGSTPF